MCRYPGKTIGASCRGFINVQLTDEEKSAILDVHNSLRNKVALGLETIGNPGPQPPASNMRIIKWNNELSEIAQRWVAQCIFSHDLCRDTYNFPVGQNIGKGNLATDNELSLIFTWYNEVKNFSNEDVFNFQLVSDQKVSFERYTQMIWADTNMLGCARAIFQQTSGPTLSYIEHFVCNYGPTGNIPDQPVYNVGKPCSTCPEGMGCSLEYEGLCEINKEETNLMALDLDNSSLKLHKKNYFMYIYLTINLIKAAFY
nr:venom allergen 3-like isoform X1 [Onthophagus taurus]